MTQEIRCEISYVDRCGKRQAVAAIVPMDGSVAPEIAQRAAAHLMYRCIVSWHAQEIVGEGKGPGEAMDAMTDEQHAVLAVKTGEFAPWRGMSPDEAA